LRRVVLLPGGGSNRGGESTDIVSHGVNRLNDVDRFDRDV
jgi:hypothetical protein